MTAFNLPDRHTLDAEQLRRVCLEIDLLAYQREHMPVSVDMAQRIESLIEAWEPLREEMIRQHVEHQGNVPGRDDMVRHDGSPCPIDPEARVEALIRGGGLTSPKKASVIRWENVSWYRVVERPETEDDWRMAP